MQNEKIKYYIEELNGVVVQCTMNDGIFWYESDRRHDYREIMSTEGIYKYCVVDGEILERSEDDIKADYISYKVDKIKSYCQCAIYAKYPVWLQNNLQSRALELLEKLATGQPLSTDEEIERAEIKNVEAEIKAMRDKSNDYEEQLQGMSIDEIKELEIVFP